MNETEILLSVLGIALLAVGSRWPRESEKQDDIWKLQSLMACAAPIWAMVLGLHIGVTL